MKWSEVKAAVNANAVNRGKEVKVKVKGKVNGAKLKRRAARWVLGSGH